jgi:site-specific recombinase XerD
MKDHQKHLSALDSYLTLKNFSKATRSSYGYALGQFLAYREAQKMDIDFTTEQARSYLLYRYGKGLKWQTINGDYSAMYKFYRYVLDLSWNVDHIPRPRKERSLPLIVSQSEVQKIIEHATSFRYQVYMVLLYSTGLRLSESLSLKIGDIDGKRLKIRVIKGKGAKDRYVDIPLYLLDLLRDYYRMYHPKVWLFNGKRIGEQWSNRAAQRCIQLARLSAGIDHSITPHVLRHCYATHHLENGTNLVYLKEQMGHKHLKTTAKYIRLCETYRQKVHHPIASMEIKYHPKVR